jgi:microsomal dipeptidase-like Zn-dependent dipeptidase
MSIALDKLLSEADEILVKKAAPAPEIDADEDIFKLAEKLNKDEIPTHIVETPIEKIARAMAILETVQTLNALEKLDKFEKTARENGYTDEEIDKYIQDNHLEPVHKAINIPESLL